MGKVLDAFTHSIFKWILYAINIILIYIFDIILLYEINIMLIYIFDMIFLYAINIIAYDIYMQFTQIATPGSDGSGFGRIRQSALLKKPDAFICPRPR